MKKYILYAIITITILTFITGCGGGSDVTSAVPENQSENTNLSDEPGIRIDIKWPGKNTVSGSELESSLIQGSVDYIILNLSYSDNYEDIPEWTDIVEYRPSNSQTSSFFWGGDSDILILN